jgi:hypothetical protein
MAGPPQAPAPRITMTEPRATVLSRSAATAASEVSKHTAGTAETAHLALRYAWLGERAFRRQRAAHQHDGRPRRHRTRDGADHFRIADLHLAQLSRQRCGR